MPGHSHIFSNSRPASLFGAFITVAVVAAGLMAVIFTLAAVTAASIEAETPSGELNAEVITDATASQNKALLFGTAPVDPSPGGDQIYLGAAVDAEQMDDTAMTNLLKQYKFTSLTAENAMKFGPIEPNQGQFNWDGADKIVNFAQANNMRVRGHTFVWHIEVPGWVEALDSQQAEAALKNHIQQMSSRYAGKVTQWDVVNEAFNDDGSLRDTPWRQKLGEDYVAKVFQWAREANPTAELYYNDFSMESSDTANGGRAAKADAVFEMVKDFKARGIPIDGVGFQTHSSGLYPGTGAAIEDNIKRLGALGVKVEITELDVKDIGDAAAQANRYAEIGQACKNSGTCTGITTWGIHDGDTWLAGKDPLLFNANLQPKPAYSALMGALGLQ